MGYCLQEELDKLKFFAKPKLALDAVGGASAVRLSEALSEVLWRTHDMPSYTISTKTRSYMKAPLFTTPMQLP